MCISLRIASKYGIARSSLNGNRLNEQYGHSFVQNGTCMYSMYFCPGFGPGTRASIVRFSFR